MTMNYEQISLQISLTLIHLYTQISLTLFLIKTSFKAVKNVL